MTCSNVFTIPFRNRCEKSTNSKKINVTLTVYSLRPRGNPWSFFCNVRNYRNFNMGNCIVQAVSAPKSQRCYDATSFVTTAPATDNANAFFLPFYDKSNTRITYFLISLPNAPPHTAKQDDCAFLNSWLSLEWNETAIRKKVLINRLMKGVPSRVLFVCSVRRKSTLLKSLC